MILRKVNVSRRAGETMKNLAVSALGIMMFSAALLGSALAASSPNTATLTPFSSEMNFMSQAGYTRYLNHLPTGQWTAFAP